MLGWPASSRAAPDGRDLAVHHPAGGDDVGAGVGLGHGGPGVELEGGVVVDLAVGRDDRRSGRGRCTRRRTGRRCSTRSSPTSARRSRSATCTMPSGSQAPEPSASLVAGTPKRITPGTPRSASSAHLLAERLPGVLHDAGQAGDRLRLGRCPPARTAGRRGRRRRGGSRRRGGAGPACGGGGGAGAGGRPPPQATVSPLDERRRAPLDASRCRRASRRRGRRGRSR